MSYVTSEHCGDDICEYNCSNMSYEHGENKFCESYVGPYEHGNGALEYDSDSYEDYDGPWDNEQQGVEEPYGVYLCEDKGFHASHHGYDGDVSSNVSYSPYVDEVGGQSMARKRQVIHREDKPKELPLEAKQNTPSKDGTKELNIEVKTPTPCAPK
ncbi:hypothetical protein H5410_031233 [Solanum commersonii]|uniref:Uncharacterized protein n=1 Tax=Solanum commersonii TaxID=4109 RepID=A0A9J5YJB3_SOLCO|nr:hypothetical protein H5410_031233 [Solanum commersonii]